MIVIMTFCFFIKGREGLEFLAVNPSREKSFFISKMPPVHILGKTSEGNNQTVDFSLEKKVKLGQLKFKEQIYFVDIKEQTIMILSPKGEILERYHLQEGNRRIISSHIDDINSDGDDSILLVTGEKGAEFGDTLLILNFDGEIIKEVYNQTFQRLNPWKVQTCDVDGDGQKEISLGVYKEAQFHPVMAKRPFIYDWQEEGMLVPKWRGSRLARPFTDYIFSDMDGSGSDELIAIEILESGKKVLHVYKWKGFGFEGVGESLPYADIEAIKKLKKEDTFSLYAFIKGRGEVKWYPFILEGEKIEVFMETKGEDK
ncbi:hypothetical protein [Clostridium formicaceticum]|uniref:VCBS repeat-containing protein n=1 Tax=Clostridium formicaceticum TaxID=1497 RepID=A0AAC9RL05_9CLOT|nr:hypothetical protein [Clostridium formicaceticum]AOY76547.1 hypothetical protein BJL90_12165 [Clostridium formicaceticum]ARE86963.1 hypothetical protein CLFO_13470 [Clostridium formicaceticum]